MSNTWGTLLTSPALWACAGDQSYTRGVTYYEEGRVHGLMRLDNALVADVVGTQTYHVELRIAGDALVGACDCPMGDAGHFCKHCVAVGLAYLEGGTLGRAPVEPSVPAPDIRGYLSSLDKDTLVALLLNLVARDADLREQLAVRAAHQGDAPVDLSLYRAAFARAAATGGYVHYREAYAYVSGLSRVHGLYQELLEGGAAHEVVTLTEEAYAALETAYEEVDDSDGMLSMVVGDFLELHHAACLVARPEPVALARKLFAWEVSSGFGFFDGAQHSYADVLGEAGRAEYRRLAQEAWEAPRRGDLDTVDWRRRMIARMLEGFARDDGDVDAVVAIKADNLSSSSAYLEIAQVLAEAGREEDAIGWAERGVAAFSDDRDDRLVRFLANLYQQHENHEAAMAIIWRLFVARPYLPVYQLLEEHATRANAWPHWRAQAWELLQTSMASGPANVGERPWEPPAGSEAVRILQWEGDPDAAWDMACAHGCTEDLWVELANQRAVAHPEESLTIYRRQVERVLTVTNQQAYERAIGVLRAIIPLMNRLERGNELGAYLASLRETYRRKRNFIKLLDALRWQ
jgi:uncharacterized Zn finger protein